MKLRLETKLSYPRIVLGAILAVFGFMLIGGSNEALGAIAVLLGMTIGLKGSFGHIFMFLIGGVLIVSFIAASYLLQSKYNFLSLDEWLIDHWVEFLLLAAYVFGIMIVTRLKVTSGWSTLVENYSDIPEWTPNRSQYPIANSIMRVDEQIYPVTVIATEVGILISKESEECLFFPWERVEHIRLQDRRKNRAYVDIARKTPVPLRIDIPWISEFEKNTPLRLVGNGA